ncbi:MAG: DNA gyrase subunit A, partial [Candidatus Thermoplasmatota archaeon]
KPVHRRILYSMYDMGMTHDKPYKKCARVVGECLGKYHPHGDVAIYDALVRLAQSFSLRYPLIDGQGNFGSVDGDSAAAMRYTESRLNKLAEELLEDIDKETVEFVDNFDSTLKEPTVLPAKLPNLLINGASGIAVGMATNIPPHCISEVIDALVKMIDEPKTSIEEIMKIIKGPDLPTGGIIFGTSGILNAYRTGRGTIKIRGRVVFEKNRIIINEIPYQVSKSVLITEIANLIKSRRIEGISDLRDESDKEGIRIVIDLKKDAISDVVLNQIFKHSSLETTYGIIFLALVDNKPEILNLQQMLNYYLLHRKDIVKNKTRYELRKAMEKAHLLEGLIKVIENLDDVIALIRSSKNSENAKDRLCKKFMLSQEQAKAVLETKLHRLTAMEREEMLNEHNILLKKIEEYNRILGSEEELLKVIKCELEELKKNYGDERKTELVEEAVEIETEDLIPNEEAIITITNNDYIKRQRISDYKQQKRGGKGLIGMEMKEEDYIVTLFTSYLHDYILFFTNKGKLYGIKAYKLPYGGRHAKGKPVISLLPKLEDGEKVSATIPVREFDEKHYIVFATKNGIIKKTTLSAYKNLRSAGTIAILLDEGDEVVDVKLSDGNDEIILAASSGKAIRFFEKEVRAMGRAARGVRGMRLEKDNKVVSMTLTKEGGEIFSITEKGYGKRTPLALYRKTRRGGKGVLTMKVTEKNGKVVDVISVKGDEELLVTSSMGMVIRILTSGIRITGRAAVGVKIMSLNEGDSVICVERLVE